jgi:tagatose-1,6-bisphosphate aldolase non-catalytic subunit AgaZ/GatZ
MKRIKQLTLDEIRERSLTREMRHELDEQGVSVICKQKDYWIARKTSVNYKGETTYTMGRVYKCGDRAFYEWQGCQIFHTLKECMEAIKKFFGVWYEGIDY